MYSKDGAAHNCCCNECPTDCTACGDEYDLVLTFAAPFDFIHITGLAMLAADGGCTWSFARTFTSGAAMAVVETSLYCEEGKWYLSVGGCFTPNGSDWMSCSWLSAGVTGICPPTGNYALTQTLDGCTVTITTSKIEAPD